MEENKKLIATINYDEDAEDPFRDDEALLLLNITRGYGYGEKASEAEANEILAEAKLQGDLIVPVSFTDHSSFYLNIGEPIDRWDSGSFGYLIVRKNCFRTSESGEASLLRYAKSAIERWNSWANGDARWVSIEEETVCPYCNAVHREQVDSCGGFIGYEEAEEYAIEMGVLKENIYEKRVR